MAFMNRAYQHGISPWRCLTMLAALGAAIVMLPACRREAPANSVISPAEETAIVPADSPAAPMTPKNPFLPDLVGEKPCVVIFSAGSCCGGDPMTETAMALEERNSNTLHVVHMDAFRLRYMAMQCGVETIPTILLYDAKGHEKAKLAYPAAVEEIETKLEELGLR